MLKVLDTTSAALTKPATDLPRDQILIEGLVLSAFIGVFEHEYETRQAVRCQPT
jgi:hypothetical protein